MALGASWNARLDVPIDDAEALETMDRANRKEFLKAIERDSTAADQVIENAIASAEGGLIRNITIATGETATVQVERAAVQAMADARARAAIPIGRNVPGFGPTTEGLVFEQTGKGRKMPTFVSVNIAQGPGYRVIRRRGKYLVQTAAGKTIDSIDSLALALLLFALLEKKRRDREAEREREEVAVR